MRKISLFLFQLFTIVFAQAQTETLTQTLKGAVTDKNLLSPINGAYVKIDNESTKITMTDKNGAFEFKNIPVGRHKITATHIQYAEISIPNILINSGKEAVVNIQMEEQVATIKGFTLKGKFNKNKPINDMATVSARTFSVEETQKFAAAVNDPARMATSFAGVVGADDGNNTIVIRGNSPTGMLWRMEGIDIPGPNHFSSFNGSGGGISILSAQLLGNSDFMTGAFAAEYGNALSGVFDLKLRKGNSKKREYTLQAGFLGLDLATEGPLSKKGGSYLVNYRYSTLGILSKIGVNIGGSSTLFQDLSFNVALPKSKFGQITFFGFGGISTQTMNAKRDSSLWKVKSDRYNFFYGSNTMAVGSTHLLQLNSKTTLRNVLLYSNNILTDKGEYYTNTYTETYTHWRNRIGNSKIALNSTLNHKISDRLHLRTGVILNHWLFSNEQRQLDTLNILRTYLNNNGQTSYAQDFAQLKIKASKKLTLFAGFHSMYLFLNKTSSFEPRASFRYEVKRNHAFTFGYGMHSQVQLPGVYFAQVTNADCEKIYPNKQLNFSKAQHFVTGYEINFTNSTRIKVETYYQQLYNIPIGTEANSTFSLLNLNDNYIATPLTNKGKGENYGVELTLERFLNKGFYYLLSTSLYSSRYKTLNNEWYNTKFNGQHALSFTAGKEIAFSGHKKILGFNIKTLWYGGNRQTPVDFEKSKLYNTQIRKDDQPFTDRLPDYFRMDAKISYRINHSKYNSIWSLDVQNSTNHKNVGGSYYDVDKGEVKTWYQTPLIPILSYKVEF
ncbi:MAG: TonB-dependent receptor [bacterium]|nr:TonB-dependent receptor [bacterium]